MGRKRKKQVVTGSSRQKGPKKSTSHLQPQQQQQSTSSTSRSSTTRRKNRKHYLPQTMTIKSTITNLLQLPPQIHQQWVQFNCINSVYFYYQFLAHNFLPSSSDEALEVMRSLYQCLCGNVNNNQNDRNAIEFLDAVSPTRQNWISINGFPEAIKNYSPIYYSNLENYIFSTVESRVVIFLKNHSITINSIVAIHRHLDACIKRYVSKDFPQKTFDQSHTDWMVDHEISLSQQHQQQLAITIRQLSGALTPYMSFAILDDDDNCKRSILSFYLQQVDPLLEFPLQLFPLSELSDRHIPLSATTMAAFLDNNDAMRYDDLLPIIKKRPPKKNISTVNNNVATASTTAVASSSTGASNSNNTTRFIKNKYRYKLIRKKTQEEIAADRENDDDDENDDAIDLLNNNADDADDDDQEEDDALMTDDAIDYDFSTPPDNQHKWNYNWFQLRSTLRNHLAYLELMPNIQNKIGRGKLLLHPRDLPRIDGVRIDADQLPQNSSLWIIKYITVNSFDISIVIERFYAYSKKFILQSETVKKSIAKKKQTSSALTSAEMKNPQGTVSKEEVLKFCNDNNVRYIWSIDPGIHNLLTVSLIDITTKSCIKQFRISAKEVCFYPFIHQLYTPYICIIFFILYNYSVILDQQ